MEQLPVSSCQDTPGWHLPPVPRVWPLGSMKAGLMVLFVAPYGNYGISAACFSVGTEPSLTLNLGGNKDRKVGRHSRLGEG